MYDFERVKKEFIEAVESAGCKMNSPILQNGRLTRTLGRVIYSGDFINRVEFSKLFLTTATDDTIRQVILHEAAHYIAAKRDGTRHGHDDYFKKICAELGCSNDKAKTAVELTVSKEKVYKYSIYCAKCGFIGGTHRYTKAFDHLEYCTCKKCGGSELSYVQNW